MGDNIRNFDDYKKKVSTDEQFTEEIDIEIQDPLDFLSASEREEYYQSQHEKRHDDYYFDEPRVNPPYEEDYRDEEYYESSDDYYEDDEDEDDFDYDALDEDEVYEREVRAKKGYIRKSARKEAKRLARQEAEDRKAKKKVEDKKRARKEAEEKKLADKKKAKAKEAAKREADDRKRAAKAAEDKKRARLEAERAAKKATKAQNKQVRSNRDYVEDDYYEDEEGINPYLVVRIASVITGILILVMIGMIFKKKVFDSVVIPDPDNDTNVSIGEMAGYTATDDVIVTTSELNLRNTPSIASDEYVVVQVPAGTELSRKYVKDDGEWAQVEYEGQTLYCVMKYAKVKE